MDILFAEHTVPATFRVFAKSQDPSPCLWEDVPGRTDDFGDQLGDGSAALARWQRRSEALGSAQGSVTSL